MVLGQDFTSGNYLTVQQRLYHLWVEPGVHLTPEDGGRNIKPAPDLSLCQTVDELGEVVSQSAGVLVPISDDGFACDNTEMDQQRGGERSYQSGRGSQASLVNLRNRDVEGREGRYLVQVLESGG